MDGMYQGIKYLHMFTVVVSFMMFVARGFWIVALHRRFTGIWPKILPHVVDTILLMSALYLAYHWTKAGMPHSFLTAKIIGLVFYVMFGVIAFRTHNRALSWVAFFLSITSFFYIVSVAFNKSPLGIFA